MKRTRATGSERRSPWLWRGVAAFAAFSLVLGVHLLRFILTPSLPRGIYLALSATPHRVGDIVSFCPPEALGRSLVDHRLAAPGYCSGGSVPLAKRITAIAPWACARPDGVLVNNRHLPWPVLSKALGLPRFQGCGQMPRDCLFMLGESLDSIDSRVFGCISASSLRDRLVPVLTERGGS